VQKMTSRVNPGYNAGKLTSEKSKDLLNYVEWVGNGQSYI
jgi:hypothetical protein